ncbi:MAG: cation transporter, partial [Armatimonadota bacterium]|nr:cation transporter [Armatimonadota bacterium]
MPRRYSLTVEGMHCAACAETVANALRKVTGVKRALVNFATERALVEVDDGVDFSALADAVKQAGYRLATRTVTFALPQPLSDENLRALQAMAGVLAVERNATGATPTVTIRYLDGTVSRHEVRQRLQALGYDAQPLEAESPEKPMRDEAEAAWQRAWIGLALSFVVMALTMLPSLTHRAWASWIAFALTTFVLLWVGTPFFRRALTAALRRTATMDTLVSIGALSAYAYSTWSLLHWSLPHWSL